jgi:hypothetical protein
MRLQKIQAQGRHVYKQVSEGMRSVGSIVEKTAHVYSLMRPMLRQSFDTRDMDNSLMSAYQSFQSARHLASEIDGIVKHV